MKKKLIFVLFIFINSSLYASNAYYQGANKDKARYLYSAIKENGVREKCEEDCIVEAKNIDCSYTKNSEGVLNFECAFEDKEGIKFYVQDYSASLFYDAINRYLKSKKNGNKRSVQAQNILCGGDSDYFYCKIQK